MKDLAKPNVWPSMRRAWTEENNTDTSTLTQDLLVLGWSQAELARRVDVHVNTVSKWMTGKSRVPGAVLAYVRLSIKVKGLLD
jgi:hypothetical protein